MGRVILVGLDSSGDVHPLLGIAEPDHVRYLDDPRAAVDAVDETCSAIEGSLAA